MKSSGFGNPFLAYAILMFIGILVLAGLILLYSRPGLMEKWADQICIACTYDTNPVSTQGNAQATVRPGGPSRPLPRIDISPSSPLPSPRSAHTVTRLLNGNILIVGGYNVIDHSTADAVLFAPATGSFRPAASPHTPRHGHTATLLPDGRVLVVGGATSPQGWLDDAELYDPQRDVWTVAAPTYSHGTAHSATLMQDGRVLVVGGCIGDSLCTDRAEIFDPLTNLWSEAAPLATDRAAHTTQLLQDGRILVSGGWGAMGRNADGDALLYDPRTDSWSATGPMMSPRSFAESVLFQDGRVLVVGGMLPGGGPHPAITSTAEIYDPASNTWAPAGALLQPRWGFSLVSFSNGDVLAVGGANAWDSDWNDGSFVRDIEIYDATLDHWSIIGNLTAPVVNIASTPLSGNRVWVTGGRTTGASWSTTWLITLLR